MSDQHIPQDNPSADHPAPKAPRRRGALIIAGVALGAALTGAVATTAVSQGFRGGPGFGHWGQGGMMGGGMMGGMIDSMIEDRADRGVRHLAIEIDATPEQEQKLRAIAKAAVKDLIPLRQTAQAAHRQAHDLLTAAVVNRADIEKFRAEQVAALDGASKRIAQATADAAEVLTPEQRRKIDNRLQGGWRGGWHRG